MNGAVKNIMPPLISQISSWNPSAIRCLPTNKIRGSSAEIVVGEMYGIHFLSFMENTNHTTERKFDKSQNLQSFQSYTKF